MVEADGNAVFHKRIHGNSTRQSGLSTGGKSGGTPATRRQVWPHHCPECGSTRLYKDGLRYTNQGPLQRVLCRDCGHRFSQPNVEVNITSQVSKSLGPGKDDHKKRIVPLTRAVQEASDNLPFSFGEDVASHNLTIVAKPLYGLPYSNSNRRVCATKEAKNLNQETEAQTVPGDIQQAEQDLKGKLVTYAFYMEKQNYSPETRRMNNGCLGALQRRNANLLDPESVKLVLAHEKAWSENRKRNVINAYSLFLKINALPIWEKPKVNVVRKIPFIPNEAEIDSLIAGSPTSVATLLQLLKETAMRSGEAMRLHWKDIDLEKRLITLNEPEKGSLPRQWNSLSPKLMDMLNAMPRNDVRIFGTFTLNSLKAMFTRARKRTALKLRNPRLLDVHFHTLRHWKATMEYHKTKDLLHVMAFLGHKKSDNTLLYVQLDEKLFKQSEDNFTTRIAQNVQEAAALVEVGFEYVTGEYSDGGKLFRKRK
jgi:integrase